MTSFGTPRPSWSSQTKLVVSLLLLALFLFLISRFRIVIAPLVLAVILAYILTPLVNQMNARFRVPRILGILISYAILIVVVSLLPLVVVPPLAGQLADLNVDLQQEIDQVVRLLSNQIVLPGGFVIDSEAIITQVTAALQTIVEPFFGRTLSLLVDVISSLIWVIFILVVSFYLIKDGVALRIWFEAQLPPDYKEDILLLRDEINKIWGAFFRGQLLLALVVAVIFVVIGFGLGLPFALAMGVLAGLLEFIPSFGHGIWLAAASVLAISVGSTWINVPNWIFMVIIIGLHLVYQQFDLNYLIPRIIGRSVHLPPLVVILGIVAGAAIAGVLGIVLAAPTIASGRIISRYIFANLFDLEPFPTEAAPPLPPPDPDWWRLRGRLETERVED
jgi:predicted PurR-regulated permease PerM